MKRFVLSIVYGFLYLVTAYANNTLSLQDLSIKQGTTEAALPISLTNENSITGFQCDLYLPLGVSVATDEYGDYVIAVARTTAKRHTISTSLQADGALRILCTSMTNATFSGNSGTVLNVTLTVSENMAAGKHNMSMKNIVLSDPDANRHTSPDMTTTLVVEGNETEGPANILSIQDLSIEQGTTEAVLPISLTNESSITGFQCDLYLPSGVSVATDEYGDYVIAVARTTAKRHTISTSLQADGALRILCTSMTNATFSGNSGTVLNVTLTVSENMAAGKHNMSMKNIVLSDPDANRHTSPDMTTTLVVEGNETEGPANILSIQDLSIEQGTTEAVLPISLTNESSITGFQCDLYLPSGVSVATDEYGDYVIAVARTTAKRHTISTSLQADGALRILCTSMTNATFSGNSGTVLNVTLTVSENMAAGKHNMSMKNIVLSDPDATRHTSSDASSSLVVTEVEKTTITANHITMIYGDTVPKLTYTSEGAELAGTPMLSCSATSTSAVGTYPITISKGSVTNKNVTYVNGTLTIVKAPLTISAGNYTKKHGEENPKFSATYSGFKNGETSAVLTKQPVFTTDVITSTSPGLYPVRVSGAEAQNYEISYVNGTITVTKATHVKITINQYGSDTYSSEYALDFSEVEGLKAYAAAGYNKKTKVVTLLRVNTTQPSMGIFLKGDSGKEYDVPVIEESNDNALNLLVATLTETPLNSTSPDGLYANYKYTIKTDDTEPKFYLFDDGSTLGADKAYLQLPMAWLPTINEASSIDLRFDDGEGTTGMENLEIRNQESELIYDLMGRRIAQPVKGSIYIVNGRKVVSK